MVRFDTMRQNVFTTFVDYRTHLGYPKLTSCWIVSVLSFCWICLDSTTLLLYCLMRFVTRGVRGVRVMRVMRVMRFVVRVRVRVTRRVTRSLVEFTHLFQRPLLCLLVIIIVFIIIVVVIIGVLTTAVS